MKPRKRFRWELGGLVVAACVGCATLVGGCRSVSGTDAPVSTEQQQKGIGVMKGLNPGTAPPANVGSGPPGGVMPYGGQRPGMPGMPPGGMPGGRPGMPPGAGR